jgi:hypothetical protein
MQLTPPINTAFPGIDHFIEGSDGAGEVRTAQALTAIASKWQTTALLKKEGLNSKETGAG